MVYKSLIKKPDYKVQVVVEILTENDSSRYNITDVRVFPKENQSYISLLNILKSTDTYISIADDEEKKEKIFRKMINKYLTDEEVALAISRTYGFLRRFCPFLTEPKTYCFKID